MKPTEEQVIAWARKAGVINCDCCLPFWPEEDQVNWEIFFERLATIAYEAGRKDEREACAKQVGQQWDAFEELKAAHYRNSPEPFDPFRFHRDLSTIFFSRDMADAIRARREQ